MLIKILNRALFIVGTLTLPPAAFAQVPASTLYPTQEPGVSSGGGTITGPLLLPDGTAASPSAAFSSDDDGSGTGIYRSAANVLTVSTNGVDRWDISSNGIANATVSRARMNNSAPSATVPTLNYAGNDADSGLGGTDDNPCIIAGGVSAICAAEAASVITFTLPDYTRHIDLPVGTALLGATPPSKVIIGTYAGRGFDADAEEMHIVFEVPSDWDGASDMSMLITWTNAAGTAVADTETVIWLADFRADATGEDIDDGSVYSSSATHTQSGAGADGEIYSTAMTIDYDNANQPLAVGDNVSAKFSRDVTTDTYGAVNATVVLWEITYTSTSFPTH